MNPEDKYTMRDWYGQPMYITPEMRRIAREMSGESDAPRKGFRVPPKNPSKGKKAAR